MPDAVIVSATRSPIGRAFKGSLRDLRPDDLATQVVRALLDKTPQVEPREIDDLILGCGLPGGEAGFNMGRNVAVELGYDFLPGTTITRYCSSSLQTTRMAAHAIRAGEGDIFISAGVESISRHIKGSSDDIPGVDDLRNPFFDEAAARTAATGRSTGTTWHDPREDGHVPDVYVAMGQTAENVARLKGVTRADQDEFAVRSQNLTEQAIADGFYAREITPIRCPDGSVVSTDDSPRAGTTPEAVAGLKPIFRADGTVTAGNACPLNDGASAVLVMSDSKAAELGLVPLACVVATAVTGLSPEIMGYGPVEAVNRLLSRAGMTIADIDLFEINEAFAAQVIPSYRDLDIPLDKLNVHGGGIALGHPYGSTGTRITGTLINGLQTRDLTWGVETMCVGGGMGMALLLERLS
ncbi:MAG: fadA [Frankiales bacterium]|nr:fadA [Frankiales bacterium]